MMVGAPVGLALSSIPDTQAQGQSRDSTRKIDVALLWIVSQITTEYPTEVALTANALIGRKSGNLSIRGIPD